VWAEAHEKVGVGRVVEGGGEVDGVGHGRKWEEESEIASTM
jgi:hypothetical protein